MEDYSERPATCSASNSRPRVCDDRYSITSVTGLSESRLYGSAACPPVVTNIEQPNVRHTLRATTERVTSRAAGARDPRWSIIIIIIILLRLHVFYGTTELKINIYTPPVVTFKNHTYVFCMLFRATSDSYRKRH